MSSPSESEARSIWRGLLQANLGDTVTGAGLSHLPWAGKWDDVLDCAGHRVAVEYKVRSDTASIASAVDQMRQRLKDMPSGVHPLLVVAHMGPTGRAFCDRAGFDWLDLAGNAHITRLPRTRIIIEGRPPAARPRGRKSNVFATKSSRLAHWLLLRQGQAHTHQQLVDATRLDKGHLSRILARLEELRLIRRSEEGVRLAKPSLILDAWREAYQPPCRSVLKGVIPSRSGQDSVATLAGALLAGEEEYVIGGLASAWMWNGFADFRISTCYLRGIVSPQFRKEIGFIETDRGANVWFMQETDDVAFLGSERRNGICVASPWFTYVDLAIHPERAVDAAAHLRGHVLKPEQTDGA